MRSHPKNKTRAILRVIDSIAEFEFAVKKALS